MTDLIRYYVLIRFLDSTHSLFLLLLFYLHFIFLSYYTLLLFYSALSVLPYLMCLFNVINVITTSSNHTRLVDFNAFLLESPFALMKACCQLAETLVSFLLLQQLSEDFYYNLPLFGHRVNKRRSRQEKRSRRNRSAKRPPRSQSAEGFSLWDGITS